MTREEMLKRMSSAELTDWMALRMIQHEEREKAQREAKLNKGR